jgi:hypothetical protein
MKRLYLVALAAGLITSLPASQAPATDTPASPAAPAPAASPSPGPTASPALTASPTPPADTSKKTATRKKKSGTMIRQQEIEHSVDTGTVPSRYRKQVPKEYQQYIPFEKQ